MPNVTKLSYNRLQDNRSDNEIVWHVYIFIT